MKQISMRNIFLILFCWFNLLYSFSQVEDSLASTDSSYYISLKDKLTVYGYGITKLNSFELKNGEGKDRIRYNPNENFNVGLGFNYSWMGIGLALNLGLFNNDNSVYGKTKSFDIQSDIFTKKLIITGNLQTYKGFYWDNIDTYDSTWNVKDSVPIRPDISTSNLGVSLIYSFNSEKFSFRSAYVNTEWQKKSAGSWLIGGQLSFFEMKADSSIVPIEFSQSYPTFHSLANMATFSIGASLGYSYTYVLDEVFFINATFLLGLSAQVAIATNINEVVLLQETKLSSRSHLRIASGINNDRYYYGLSFVIDSYPIKNKLQSEFIFNYGKVRIFYGRHFDLSKRTRRKNS